MSDLEVPPIFSSAPLSLTPILALSSWVAYQFPHQLKYHPATSLHTFVPSPCPWSPYCFPAIAGQCPHPIEQHIYHFCFLPHPPPPRLRLAYLGYAPRIARKIFATATYLSTLHAFCHSSVMPFPTTPQRPRTSSLKFSHVKVRIRFGERWFKTLTTPDRQRLCSYHHFPIVKQRTLQHIPFVSPHHVFGRALTACRVAGIQIMFL